MLLNKNIFISLMNVGSLELNYCTNLVRGFFIGVYMMQCKKLFMVDKETSDITGNTPPLYPAIEYHPCVVLVTYRRDDYKYTQFEGDNRLEDSYNYYVELVKENSNLFIRMIDNTKETDII